MERVMTRRAAQALYRRRPLRPDPAGSIAIKRDVHEFEVEIDAAVFVDALHELLIDAESVFGIIRVKRPSDRMGRRFEVGERFQGCFSLERGLSGWVGRVGGERLSAAFVRLLRRPGAASLVRWLEDQLLSNYAEVQRLDMTPNVQAGESYVLRYAYLDGTPIAGTNTYTLTPLGANRCLVTQTFEYQEVNGIALATFQRFGLKFHDQVVHQQVAQAAARLGVSFRGTVPQAYAQLGGAA